MISASDGLSFLRNTLALKYFHLDQKDEGEAFNTEIKTFAKHKHTSESTQSKCLSIPLPQLAHQLINSISLSKLRLSCRTSLDWRKKK